MRDDINECVGNGESWTFIWVGICVSNDEKEQGLDIYGQDEIGIGYGSDKV